MGANLAYNIPNLYSIPPHPVPTQNFRKVENSNRCGRILSGSLFHRVPLRKSSPQPFLDHFTHPGTHAFQPRYPRSNQGSEEFPIYWDIPRAATCCKMKSVKEYDSRGPYVSLPGNETPDIWVSSTVNTRTHLRKLRTRTLIDPHPKLK